MSEQSTEKAQRVGVADDAFMVTQTILASPELNAQGIYGNCIQAAVASTLGWPLDAVPHFGAFQVWRAALKLWAEGEGFVYEQVRGPSAVPVGERCLYIGQSPRGYTHVVVGVNGKVAWDPHPSREGLDDVTEVIRIHHGLRASRDVTFSPAGGEDRG